MSDNQESKQLSGWAYWAERFGLPAFFYLLLFVSAGYIVQWTATHVVTPLIDAHTDFLKHEKEQMTEIKESIKVQTETQKQHLELLRQIRDDQRKGVWRNEQSKNELGHQTVWLSLLF